MTFNVGDLVDFHIENGERWKNMEVYDLRSTDGITWLFTHKELKMAEPLYKPSDFECDI